jgi:excisionase family DNA binding protein
MMIHRYISMPEIRDGKLDGLEPGEHAEAMRQFARGMSNLAALPTEPATAAATDKFLYDAAAAALYLSCAKSFIRKAYRDGKLRFVRQGMRGVRFTKEALDAFAMSGQNPLTKGG